MIYMSFLSSKTSLYQLFEVEMTTKGRSFLNDMCVTACDIPVIRLGMLQGAENLIWISYFHILAAGSFSCFIRPMLAMCAIKSMGQRQCYLCMLNSDGGLRPSIRCRQSRYPLLCFLFVSVWLLLFLYFVVSLILVDCSDETSFEVCARIDGSSWKDVQESDVVLLLSDGWRKNECMPMRLPRAMQRHFSFKSAVWLNA